MAALALLLAIPPTTAGGPPAAVVVASSSAGWTTFHGAENRSGFTPEAGPATGHLLLDIEPTFQPIRVGPVVAGGFVYGADALGKAFAVNLSGNASVAWRTALGTTPTTPDLAGGLLLLGGSDGYVTALAAANGSMAWTRRLDGRLVQAVSVENGSAFAATSNGTLYDLRLVDGSVAWQLPLGAPVDAGVAVEGGLVVVAAANGNLTAVTLGGAVAWTAAVGAAVDTSPAVYGGTVIVGDLTGNVSAFDLANGTDAWRFVGRTLAAADHIEATPAVGDGAVFVSTDLGEVYALDLATGSLRWQHATGTAGYAMLSSPALTPTGLYVCDAVQELLDLAPSNGTTIWRATFAYTPVYSSPAVAGGELFVGDDLGALFGFAPAGGPTRYTVSGRVVNASGAPLAADVLGPEGLTTTAADGTFALSLPNGSYALNVSSPGYFPVLVPVAVQGADVALAPTVLGPVPTVPLAGRVIDGHALRGLGGALVTVYGEYGYLATTRTAADGSFLVGAPTGDDYVTVGPPSGYAGLQVRLTVGPNGSSGIVLPLAPTALGVTAAQHPWDAVVPFAAMAAAGTAVGVWHATRRRVEAGLPPRLLSRFGRYFVMRALLIVVQVVAVLLVLYVFGSILPAVAYGANPCSFYPAGGCVTGSWSDPATAGGAFLNGFGTFLANLFTLNWGSARFGSLVEPAVTFLAWWFPDSFELALFALPMAAALAYVIGVRAGSRAGGGVDFGARLASVAGLLVPSFLVVLLFLGTFYGGFLAAFGDIPYGVLPSPEWWVAHGGPPRWIGIGSNSSPTGLPLLDGALHGDWPFVELVLVKTLWQALAIAAVYVAIFLRYVRHAVAQAHAEPHVAAERARGLDEGTILWRHTGRRVIPLFLLVFGMTLPIYIGTQSLVEALANDSGVGTLLIAEMTNVATTGFGYKGINPASHPGNFYQVTIFLLLVLVLVGNLCADLLARYFDPRLDREGRR